MFLRVANVARRHGEHRVVPRLLAIPSDNDLHAREALSEGLDFLGRQGEHEVAVGNDIATLVGSGEITKRIGPLRRRGRLEDRATEVIPPDQDEHEVEDDRDYQGDRDVLNAGRESDGDGEKDENDVTRV